VTGQQSPVSGLRLATKQTTQPRKLLLPQRQQPKLLPKQRLQLMRHLPKKRQKTRRKSSFTAKQLHDKAQGRAAHPGLCRIDGIR